MMKVKSSTLFVCGPLPHLLYVHLTSTWCHSRYKCSQTFPVFHHSSAFLYYTERKLKDENREQGYLQSSYGQLGVTLLNFVMPLADAQ